MGIRNEDTRNLVRGLLASIKGSSLTPKAANLLRKEATPEDLARCATLFLGKEGAFPFSNQKPKWNSLLRPHGLEPIAPNSEAAYTIGHLNGWVDEAVLAIESIRSLADLPTADPRDALSALQVFAGRWGASNYLAKKIAFVMALHGSTKNLGEEFRAVVAAVEDVQHPTPYFVALEILDLSVPYFTGANTRIQLLRTYVTGGDFRQILSLHNLAAAPLSYDDVGSFLRKAHSMSFVDEIVALAQLRNVASEWSSIHTTITKLLDPKISRAFEHLDATPFFDKALYADVDPESADLAYYRRALAFLEFRQPALYRHHVDRVVAPRLLSDFVFIGLDYSTYAAPTRRELTMGLTGFRKPTDYLTAQSFGRFLRTVQFLTYGQLNGFKEPLTQHEIRTIFEHTTGLDILLTEGEIEMLYALADPQSRPIVTTLAMALHKSRSADEDVDFKFRKSLSDTIIQRFNGDVVAFVEWLIPSTPEVAHFVVATLDRMTLQKLYWIIKTPDEADRVRQAILNAVGRQRQRIEYLIEANAIEAQRRVAKLGRYFDESRMYVDSIAMTKWLHDNPSVYTQQFARMIEHGVDKVPARAAVVSDGRFRILGETDLPIERAFDYMLNEAAGSAFTQFCKNENFGIESYLSRRIRHNTLSGMMRSDVESLLEQPRYRALSFDDAFVAAHAVWTEHYRAQIERIRRDLLQFRSDQKPKGLLTAVIDPGDAQTKANLSQLRQLAIGATRDPDLLNELLIRFCWIQIDPQLKSAARTFSVELANDTLKLLDEALGAFEGSQYDQFRTELRQIVHEKFARLGSWFRQPDTAFVQATTREIGDLIYLESSGGTVPETPLTWSGTLVDTVLNGPTVHRVYDCMSVLLQNAIRYGGSDQIEVSVDGESRIENRIACMRVTVRSSLTEVPNERISQVEKLRAAFGDNNIAASMVAEGFSGIRKLRFIANAAGGGFEGAGYEITDDGKCAIHFQFDVELAPAADQTA
jgi:hypothetical protein